MYMKKWIVALFSLVLLRTAWNSSFAWAADNTKTATEIKSYNDEFYYINHGDHIEIVDCAPYVGDRNGYFSDGLTIPREIDGLPVTAIAEGAFSGTRFWQVLWPEWITTVPKNCFKDCGSISTIVFPDTLERIEDGAFDGNDFYMADIFYMGDDAGWDAVSIGAGNTSLKKANVHTNFNTTNGREQRFVFGEDNWSFSNNELTEFILSDMEEYALSDETILKYLKGCNAKTIERHVSAAVGYTNMYDKGFCLGFALTSYLVCSGVLEPSDIYEGAETLHDIPLCKEAAEAIAFFQQLSHLSDLYTGQQCCNLDIEYLESGQFLSDMEQGKAVVFCYFIDRGGHAVIACGIEQGVWKYGDKSYTNRILIYDNNRIEFEDEVCIYYNGDFEDMYIPYWDSTANFSDFFYEPHRITYSIGNRTAYKSTYTIGDLDKDEAVNAVDAAEILAAAASEGSGSDSGLNNGQQYAADVNSDGVFNAIDAALVLEYAAYAGAGGEVSLSEYIASL